MVYGVAAAGGRARTDVVGGDDELGAVVAHEGEHHEVALDGLEEEEHAVVARPPHLRAPRAARGVLGYAGAVFDADHHRATPKQGGAEASRLRGAGIDLG